MADRTRYLLAYDIRDARRLRRVHEVAKSYGEPLQYSVFVCDLTRVELLGLRADLLLEMNLHEDSVGIFDLGPPSGRGLRCVEFIGARRPLPRGDEAAIW
ncbi:MAG TPA: CRISPR-associated endonuclease Cas2 [Gaiellaceae bacterium]|jgi:CRISPR-associated protein Cas2|nr:CRISPR-associated endonuclease Cas2 [Gaiellaceae bacterium]